MHPSTWPFPEPFLAPIRTTPLLPVHLHFRLALTCTWRLLRSLRFIVLQDPPDVGGACLRAPNTRHSTRSRLYAKQRGLKYR